MFPFTPATRPLFGPRETVLALFHITLLGGCSLHAPDPAPRPGIEAPAYSTGAMPSPKAESAPWWQTLESVRLNDYVDRALVTSRTVQAAQARLEQAEAVYQRAAAAPWPALDLKGRQEKDLKTDTPRGEYKEFGIAASWEIDFFGRLKSTRIARGMDRESRAQLLRVARLSLSVNVTESYLGVIEQKQLLRLLNYQKASAVEFLKIIQERFDQGLISRVDLLQQQSQVADIQSLIPDAEANLRVQQNLLSTLVLGRPTEGGALDFDDTLPVVGPLAAIGRPDELLLRRPDLLALKADLTAADADIGRAMAERLPKLTFAADALLVDGRGREGVLSTMTPGFLLPLVDWGNRRAEVTRSQAVYRERFAIFAQGYLDAILEVENAVLREGRQKELIATLEERRDLLNEVLLQTQGRYKNGLTDYLPVLTSLQQLNAVEQRLIRERRKLLSFRVALCRALGGPLPDAVSTVGVGRS